LDLEADICVVGGGPAGSALAGRLAALGHAVVLLEAEVFPRPHIGESLPPGMGPLLDALGVRVEVEAAGFLRPWEVVVRWAGEVRRRGESLGEPGFQVDRGIFDHILLRAAVKAGVRLLQPARALTPRRQEPGLWIIPVRGEGPDQVRARFLVDACGRQGLVGKRKRRLIPATVALYGYWRGAQLTGPETRVEAGPEQWYWGAPLPNGTFNATVFVSPSRLRCADQVESVYRSLLAESELLAGCLAGQLTSSLRVCTAAMTVDDAPVGEDWLAVGESAFALDPLSSQGVRSAIVSGLQGAAVIHTSLTTPEHREAARQFARDRHAESVRQHTELAASFYQEQKEHQPTRFWVERSAMAPHGSSRWRSGALLELTATDRVVVSPETRFVHVPALCGDLIRPVRAVVAPGADRPAAFVGDIPVALLIEPLAGACSVGEILQAWSPIHPPRRAVSLLLWAMQEGVIVRAGSSSEPSIPHNR
jgi:flavin-dependent dehydrogenase